MYQYWSKWRDEWIDFTPTQGQLIQMEIYKYKVRRREGNRFIEIW